jgi:hypothetical protein
MKLFSLSHLNELASELPDPNTAVYRVLRLPLRDWDSVRDAEHPDREFEAHHDDYIEFEVVPWRDSQGISYQRWVLRSLVAM